MIESRFHSASKNDGENGQACLCLQGYVNLSPITKICVLSSIIVILASGWLVGRAPVCVLSFSQFSWQKVTEFYVGLGMDFQKLF
jgi:hypothetical protein